MLEIKERAASVEKRTLREVAVFPDCAKDEPQYCGRRPSPEEIDVRRCATTGTGINYHLHQQPACAAPTVAGGAGTGETDIVQMIGYTVEQLRGQAADPSKFGVKLEDTEPLWLLAHLVGDIHQPLHVGQDYYDTTCKNDRQSERRRRASAITTLGGNSIELALTAQR